MIPDVREILMQIYMRVLLFLLCVWVAFAQLPSGVKPPGEDWVQLFNGKDLTGWKNVGKEEWNILPDGVLQGKAVTKEYGYLETARDYKDFTFSVRFKCVGSGNSGIYYHTRFKPGTVDVSQGAQFEIDCAVNRHTAGVYDVIRQWLVWPAPENETVVRQNDWNEMTVTVMGNRYISRLNGVPMVDFTDPRSRFLEGTIALQLHSGGDGHMLFKDIWLRDLARK
jgi:hypothetical protein